MKKDNKDAPDRRARGLFAANGTFYLFDYNKMTVAQATALRKTLRKQGAALKVVKNRLALRALPEAAAGDLRPAFRKPTAVALHLRRPHRPGQGAQGIPPSRTRSWPSRAESSRAGYFAAERFDEIVKLAPGRSCWARSAT